MKLTHRAIVKALFQGKYISAKSILNDGWALKLDASDGDEVVSVHIKTGTQYPFPTSAAALNASDWRVIE